MPTMIIDRPRINLSRKRSPIQKLVALVASAGNWPFENIVVIVWDNPEENVARGGRLLIDGGSRSSQAHRPCSDGTK